MHIEVEWRGCGGGEIQLSRRHGQRGAEVVHGRAETECGKCFHSHLIVRIKVDPTTCTNDRFPSRFVASNPCNSQTRCKIVPGSVPQWCAPGSKCQRTGVANAAEQRKGIITVHSMRRRIDLPAQTNREIQPWGKAPFILNENGHFIEDWRGTY